MSLTIIIEHYFQIWDYINDGISFESRKMKEEAITQYNLAQRELDRITEYLSPDDASLYGLSDFEKLMASKCLRLYCLCRERVQILSK